MATVSRGTSESGPPNQSANAWASVHSFQTVSRGASNTRVIAMPYSAIVTLQPLLHPVEAALPEAAVALEPVRRVLQRRRAQSRGTALRRTATLDQACPLEHSKMLRDRLDADRERLGQLVHRRVTVAEPLEDCAPGWIGERCERGAEAIRGHLLHLPGCTTQRL